MKYRPSEQVIVDNINAQVKRLKHKQLSKSSQIDKLNQEINDIDATIYKIGEPVRRINKRVKDRCKHKGETHKGGIIYKDFSPNDIRFIFCNDCEESIGSEDVSR